MHQNLKIEIERINNQYVTQIELSTFGRCGRARLVSATFDEALQVLKAKHDELLASAMAFHSGVSPATNITHPSEATAGQKASAALKRTREELEAVAAAEGVKGLRNIAAPLGVKGTSMDGLIDGILQAQAALADAQAAQAENAEQLPAVTNVMKGAGQTKEAPRQFASV